MRIKGILATEVHKLSPEQWVNVYELSLMGAEFYDCCQVKDLVDLENPSEYGLELIDEGKVMPVGEALK
jgi:hypothetical protein